MIGVCETSKARFDSGWSPQQQMPEWVYIFFVNKKAGRSDSFHSHYMGGLVAVKLDSFNFCCCISGIRIAAIASAFQAEYDRGFESHIPLHLSPLEFLQIYSTGIKLSYVRWERTKVAQY